LSRRTVLILAYHFLPSTLSGALRPYRFYKYLPRAGYQATVLTSTGGANERPNVYSLPSAEALSKWSPQGMAERLLVRFAFQFELGLPWIQAATSKAIEIHEKEPFAAVFSTFPPVAAHLVAARLQRKLGMPWVADFRDPLSGNPFRAQKGLPAWVDQNLERYVFNHAQAVIANTDTVAARWRSNYPEHKEKVHLIWNGFDPEDVVPQGDPPADGVRTLAHFGWIYGDRHPGLLLESVARLIDNGLLSPQLFRILLQGSMEGAYLEWNPELRKRLTRLGCLEERNFMLPREEMQKLQSTAHYQLIIDLPGEKPSAQVPGKLFEYLQIGRPILALTVRNSAMDRLMEQAGIPSSCIYYGMRDEQVDEAVLRLLAMPPVSSSMNLAFARNFNGVQQADTLARIVDQIRR
jgi:glycosyltransferase involved in cell wall biosynthesis